MSRNLNALCLAGMIFLAGCKHSPPPNVAAVVNGYSITYADLDKQFKSQFAGASEKPNDDQTMFQKLELLRTMIDNRIMLQRAEKGSLLATDADVESKLNELKAPYTQEQFQKQLADRHMTLDDLKAQIRQDLSIQKLFNKEITSHINITDKDVADFYNANKASFNLVEPQIHLAQILVTATPNPEVRNLKNDKAQNDEQAKTKIEMLLARIRQGEDFSMLAQNYSEDPASAQNGGDLGFISQSALDKASPDVRKLVMSTPPGQVSGILHSPEGYRILKVIAKEPAGQRELQDPRVQQTIRETLLNRKDQLLKAAYYEVARNEAKVTNYFALTITQEKDKGK
jgi:peptidyl-prolyl cis-trans isomerase SurA